MQEIADLTRFIDHWPLFDDLKVIVAGSSDKDKDGFISSGAFVGEHKFGKLPRSVRTLRDETNQYFYGGEFINWSSLDCHATHSKMEHGILFINVCLSKDNKALETAKLTIRFINRILQVAKLQICVLDMRLDMHAHISEDRFWRDEETRNSEDQFKINKQSEVHKVCRFEHPGYTNNAKYFEESWVFISKDEPRRCKPLPAMPVQLSSLYRSKEKGAFWSTIIELSIQFLLQFKGIPVEPVRLKRIKCKIYQQRTQMCTFKSWSQNFRPIFILMIV